jgi:riboflavin transporter FmnP
MIAVFTALTLAINVYGPKIPAPYAPFLIYQFWEIPIVVAFLAIGVVEGVIIALINMVVLLIYYPGALPLGPVYNFIALLSTLLGVYIIYRIATHRFRAENSSNFLRQHFKLISISATVMGIVLRVAIMTGVNFFALQQPLPVGYSLNSPEAIAYLPLIGAFNASVAAYTVPIALGIIVVALPITSRFNRPAPKSKA